MKKVVAFGASNSKTSINKELATWAANQGQDVEVKVLDLNDFEMPIFSIDRENESGIPAEAQAFKEEIKGADGLVISFAEHNGNFSSAFKNVFDWVSRIEQKVWLGKPMFLLSTSPGPRGGASALGIAVNGFPYSGAGSITSYSLPSFGQNFSKGITDEALKSSFKIQSDTFNATVHEQKIEESVVQS
ncbi:MAG: NAD(P)H-dependent oxidoreductase [Reichenbachiella sp.]